MCVCVRWYLKANTKNISRLSIFPEHICFDISLKTQSMYKLLVAPNNDPKFSFESVEWIENSIKT